MATYSSFELAPQKALFGAVIVLCALLLGFLLVDSPLIAILGIGGIIWCATLPYHDRLGAYLVIVLSQSALIIPFLPGPIYVAEAASLLTLSALPLAIIFRRYSGDTNWLFRRNRLVFVGLAAYAFALVGIVMIRGVSAGSMGGGQGGAKIYFQQFVYMLVPCLFLFIDVKEETFKKLVILYFVLPFSFVISEVALIYAPSIARWLLAFLALPTDSRLFNDTASSMTFRFGFRRLQSLYLICPGLIFALVASFSVRSIVGKRSAILIPAVLGLLVIGLASGHRANLIHTGSILLVVAVVQRAFNAKNTIILSMSLLVGVALVYGTVRFWPPAMQRAVSFLPKLDVESVVAMDAKGTWQGRIDVTQRGIEQIPKYFWLGRGFTRYTDIVPYSLEDRNATEWAVLQGHFLNGFVGAMVNTGIWGTIGISLFIFGGALLTFRVVGEARRWGFEDPISRIGCVIASIYLVDAVFFYLIEGNIDGALKRFGILIGILFICERCFHRRRLRMKTTEADESAEMENLTHSDRSLFVR